jgi:MbtH protein
LLRSCYGRIDDPPDGHDAEEVHVEDHESDGTVYEVVRNHEEQYSIWPADRPVPAGWQPVGFSGGKDECLAHIDQVWTDMRPLSLRIAMAADRPD